MRLGCLLLFAWFFAVQALPLLAQPARPADAPKGPLASPEANQALDACLKQLEGMKRYHVKLRQEGLTPTLRTTMDGRLVFGPDRKVRYELKAKHGAVAGELKFVCDGTTIWRLEDVGAGREAVVYRLAELETEIQKLAAGGSDLDLSKVQELKKDVELEHGFRGILPTLEDLKAKLVFTQMKPEQLEVAGAARPVLVLDGQWNKEVRAAIIPPKPEPAKGPDGKEIPNAPKPADPTELYEKRQEFLWLPRRAKLTLDAATKLPLRLEWFGPTRFEGPEELLSRLEWLGLAPLPADQLAAEVALSAEEKLLPSKPIDFKEALKRKVDNLIAQQKRERSAMQPKPSGRP